MNDDKAAAETEDEAWVTVGLQAPGPNARWAGFVTDDGGDTVRVMVREVDYVALQHIADENGDVLESRIVPVLFGNYGECVVLSPEERGRSGFCALGATEAAVVAKAEEIRQQVAKMTPAAPAASAAAAEASAP
jgi:hypothetical protein